MTTDSETPSSEPPFTIHATRNFTQFLTEQKISVAFTTYQANKMFLIGTSANQLKIEERTFERSMGMAFHEDSLYLGTAYQIWKLQNYIDNDEITAANDKVYVPNQSWVTGDIDIHDIAIDANGKPLFVNTVFSCISTTSDHASFDVVWKPPFISKLAPEDRCHLNGMALVEGELNYVTAISNSDVREGWREHRQNGGIVINTKNDDIVCTGLSMPHSPRVYKDKLWLLNSGKGEFGFIDLSTGRFEATTFCPGYGRGLSIHNGYAFIGLSKPRKDGAFAGLELDEKLSRHNISAHCGILVIDLNTGDIVHSLMFEGVVRELYDAAVLPGVITPTLVGFKDDTIRKTIRIGNTIR